MNENDELFSEKEFEQLDLIVNNNLDELRKKGKVSFTKSEVDGIITETLIFTDFNGENTFTRVSSYNKNDKMYEKVKAINKKMLVAIERENYEDAAKLKKAKEELLFNSTKQ